MIKFRSKFQFQIILQFYRTAEKVTKIKVVIVIVKSFEKYHHLFNLNILVTIFFFFFSWLRFKRTEYKDLNLANKIFIKNDIVQEQVYEVENLSVPHFLTISSNTALLHLPNENLYLVFWGITRPIKNGPNTLWLTPPFDDFKISPKLYVPPTLTNMRTMRRQYTKFSLLLVPQANLFTRLFTTPANCRPLSRSSVTNRMLITEFDTYSIPRSSGAW